MSLKHSLHKYFWDIDCKKARPKSYPEYYISRILELGDKNAFGWLKAVFGNEKIKKISQKAKLSPKSSNYWRLIFK